MVIERLDRWAVWRVISWTVLLSIALIAILYGRVPRAKPLCALRDISQGVLSEKVAVILVGNRHEMDLDLLKTVDAAAKDEKGVRLATKVWTRTGGKLGPMVYMEAEPAGVSVKRIFIEARVEYRHRMIDVNAVFFRLDTGMWEAAEVIVDNAPTELDGSRITARNLRPRR